ncbi:MAG TPA: flagellar assembly protein FliH [Steroidobacteraceae bacterium]|jgi:flagellar assembly protein FliH|nr:flagellar assembly protein FliH [Steroidobacteraceae bacterium]
MFERGTVAKPWALPSVEGKVGVGLHNPEELQGIRREAWDKGFAEGHQAGLAAAHKQEEAGLAEIERRTRQLASILDFMAKPLADLDVQVQRQLAELAGAIARHVVRRELKASPDQIIAVIRETVLLLPMTARDVRVHLHPEDARLVRSRLAEATSERAWSIMEDPIMAQGGCRVTSEDSTIDAQLEQRIGAAIAAVLGEDRSTAARQQG